MAEDHQVLPDTLAHQAEHQSLGERHADDFAKIARLNRSLQSACLGKPFGTSLGCFGESGRTRLTSSGFVLLGFHGHLSC
jgi:hypothetical protein